MPLQAVQLSLIYINTPYKRRESKRVSNSAFTHPIHTLFIFSYCFFPSALLYSSATLRMIFCH